MKAPKPGVGDGPLVDWSRGRKALMGAIVGAASIMAPPPPITISQWADTYRMLGEASSEQGRWNTDRAPFQREMMDVLVQPGVREAVYMLASQLGKTELELNVLGYFMHYQPSPVLIVYPNLEMGKHYSKTRLAPMIRDCPALKQRVKDPKSRDGDNTVMMKAFPGGYLVIGGANSPAGLSSYPIRVVLCDEIDRFPPSAGAEGDPVELAFQRTQNFWNHLKIVVGTPTLRDRSPIAKRFATSDQRHFYVPCPECHTEQVLEWKQVVWDKSEDGRNLPETAGYACPHCGVRFDMDAEKETLLKKGRWVRHNPVSKIPGFTLNAIYSPWLRLCDLVDEFLKKKALGPEGLKTFFNTKMAETWDPQMASELNTEGMMARRESYPAQVPWGVGCLTAFTDTQDDRLEFIVRGWGHGNESWLIHREVIPGSPALPDVWEKLDRLRLQGYRHASGRMMFIEAMGIDLGGHFPNEVRNWAKPRIPQRVFPTRGSPIPSDPLIQKSRNKRLKEWRIGVRAAKDTILKTRIRIEAPGPGYMHFPIADWCDLDYFNQLATSEHEVWSNAGRNRLWQKVKNDVRNEALDLEVGSWAVYTLLKIKPEEMEHRLARLERPLDPSEFVEEPNPEEPKKLTATAPKRKARTLSRGFFES